MITLVTLPQATEQEVFDQVVIHLFTQKTKSVDGNNETCVYRTPDGKKCAAGCLISDEEYDSDIEGEAWTKLVEKGFAPNAHVKLISALQRVHDHFTPHEWYQALHIIATMRDFTFPKQGTVYRI